MAAQDSAQDQPLRTRKSSERTSAPLSVSRSRRLWITDPLLCTCLDFAPGVRDRDQVMGFDADPHGHLVRANHAVGDDLPGDPERIDLLSRILGLQVILNRSECPRHDLRSCPFLLLSRAYICRLQHRTGEEFHERDSAITSASGGNGNGGHHRWRSRCDVQSCVGVASSPTQICWRSGAGTALLRRFNRPESARLGALTRASGNRAPHLPPPRRLAVVDQSRPCGPAVGPAAARFHQVPWIVGSRGRWPARRIWLEEPCQTTGRHRPPDFPYVSP